MKAGTCSHCGRQEATPAEIEGAKGAAWFELESTKCTRRYGVGCWRYKSFMRGYEAGQEMAFAVDTPNEKWREFAARMEHEKDGAIRALASVRVDAALAESERDTLSRRLRALCHEAAKVGLVLTGPDLDAIASGLEGRPDRNRA